MAATFQRTTLAAHMKRKSDTLCHAEMPGLLCSSLIDLPYSTLSLEKKGKFFHDGETFALVTDTRLVVNRATIASTWRSALERHSLSTSHSCYSWPYPLRQATHYIARNPRNRQAHTACHPITVYAQPKRHTMNWVQPNHTPLTAFTHPFSFPTITSAGVATAFPSLVPSTVLRCASGNTRISCLRGHPATGPCTQRRPGLSCVPPSAGAGRGGEIVASCPGMPSNR